MFVLFINDMPEVVTSCIDIFADDAKIFKAMLTEQYRSDLQEDMDNLKIGQSHGKLTEQSARASRHGTISEYIKRLPQCPLGRTKIRR